jgi:carboxyl-terminal processing protease
MKRCQTAAGRSLLTRLVAVALLVAVAATPLRRVAAELDGPKPGDRKISLLVAALIKRDHLRRKVQPLDDKMSRRCLANFLKDLDPMKVYFTQSDIDTFVKQQDTLDDQVKRGDISFAYTVFNTFLKRIDERVKLVDKYLEAEHDFTVDETMVTDKKLTTYAKSAAEAQDRWRKRIKYDLLVQKADEKTLEEARKKLHRRYSGFAKRMHQTDHEELMEMFLSAMTRGFDPHTTYMAPKTLENFEIMMRLQLEGIGAALQSTDGETVVTKVIPGGAADKEGSLAPEDRIVGVSQGTDGEMVDTVDMKLGDVVQMIRGKRGTVVRLEVISAGKEKRVVYTITRAKIALKDSEARGEIIDFSKKADGSPFKIGVINLPSFYMDMTAARLNKPDFKSTTRDVERLIIDFKTKGIDAVVIDLRMNGGGSLTESIKLTGLFIDKGPVVQVKDANGRVQHYDDLDRGMLWEGPLVVLTSKFSASASEIFAGAIQDYHRGLIVGDPTTHGKGTVQSLLDLGRQLFRGLPNAPKLGALKITMQQFYRPNGDSTQNRGVLADVSLPSLTSQLDVGESDLDFAVEFDKVSAAAFKVGVRVDPVMIKKLSEQSAKRCESSAGFQKMGRRIIRYNEVKNRKVISLNEKTFLAERAKDKEDDDKKDKDKNKKKDKPVFKMDYYGKEVLAIAVDYLGMLNPKIAAR